MAAGASGSGLARAGFDARPAAPTLRRRIGGTGCKAQDAAWTILPPDGAPPRLILSSRHGEYGRTFTLLDSLAAEGEVSPADFSLSVHHALIGLLSIATRNTAGHSAIAAGPDTFGFALLEAIACLRAENAPVLVMHFDDPPPVYDMPPEPALALALLLTSDGPYAMEISPGGHGHDSLPLAFAEMLDGNAPEARADGARMTWRWRHAA